jgi:hypothetical protein
LRPLLLAVLLFAAAVTLARALMNHDGVGPFEYIVGVAILALLLVAVVRLTRRALKRDLTADPAAPDRS